MEDFHQHNRTSLFKPAHSKMQPHLSVFNVLRFLSGDEVSLQSEFLSSWIPQQSRQSNKLQTAFQPLNITQYSNLFEVSGCLLRLSLRPTDSFWSTSFDETETETI